MERLTLEGLGGCVEDELEGSGRRGRYHQWKQILVRESPARNASLQTTVRDKRIEIVDAVGFALAGWR